MIGVSNLREAPFSSAPLRLTATARSASTPFKIDNLARVCATDQDDIITITADGTDQAHVQIRSRTGEVKTNTTISAANGILVDAGKGNDEVIVDARIASTLTVIGGEGTDQFFLRSNGVQNAVYRPGFGLVASGGKVSYSASVATGKAIVMLHGFELAKPVLLDGFRNVTFVTPSSEDRLTITGPDQKNTRIQGTSNGAKLLPVVVTGAGKLTVDMAENDGTGLDGYGSSDDTIRVLGTGSGRNVIVVTGDGEDRLELGPSGMNTVRGNLVFDGIRVDRYENNNTIATASSLGSGPVSEEPLTIHALGDNDYFSWTAPSSGTITARIQFDGKAADLDLMLLDKDGRMLDVSKSLSGYEQVSTSVVAGQIYFLRVYSPKNDRSQKYDVTVAFEETTVTAASQMRYSSAKCVDLLVAATEELLNDSGSQIDLNWVNDFCETPSDKQEDSRLNAIDTLFAIDMS